MTNPQDHWKVSVRGIIDEAMKDFDLDDIKVKAAISQAVFQAVGYTESRVLVEAQKRMEVTRWNELLREIKQ